MTHVFPRGTFRHRSLSDELITKEISSAEHGIRLLPSDFDGLGNSAWLSAMSARPPKLPFLTPTDSTVAGALCSLLLTGPKATGTEA